MKVECTVKNSSLELNWLPNSIRKDLILPQIRYVSNSGGGGAYYRVQDWDNDWGDLTKRPLIEIDISWFDLGINEIASTIAHEFRHHWQLYKYGRPPKWPWKPSEDYKEDIIKYYIGAWHEMDALCYEVKHAPSETNLEWKEWILEYENNERM